MPLTKEQLLIPRALCIGGKDGELIWPWSTLRAGQILKSQIEEGEVSYKFLDPIENDYRFLNQMGIENFPHLFKPLPWWYGRTVEEMPLYVKQTGMVDSKDRPVPDIVVKVKKHFSAGNGEWRDDNLRIFCADSYLTGGHGSYSYDDWEPADEFDYQEYQKQKQ